MTISSMASGGRVVLALSGDADLGTVWQLRDLANEFIATGHVDLVIDLNGVEFIDSSGIGVLIRTQARARRAGGSLRVVRARPRTLRLFELTGLTSAFDIHPDTAAALRTAPPRSAALCPRCAGLCSPRTRCR
ncbi:STAS domain-containing protein [Kribbella steppae]|nr:STAS domain-containing protein [Kribbella steppae]